MLKNYIKIAWRNLLQNKVFAFINILGLALGITCCILIYSFVQYHLSFDNFHKNSDRIYRVVTEEHQDYIDYEPSVPPPLGKEFRADYTYGEKVARITTLGNQILSFSENGVAQKYKEEIAFIEPEFFDIFNYPLKSGEGFEILSDPNMVFLTEKMARKFFGDIDPINKTFLLDNRIELTVKGILKNLPPNTLRQTDIFISYATLKTYGGWISQDSWAGISSNLQCFTLLRPNVSPRVVEAELQKYVQKYRPDNKNVHHYKLQPLSEVHFDTRYDGAISKNTLVIFSFIGLFLIVAACINFINMSTAQTIRRAQEVGVQKVLGSHKRQLFRRSLLETSFLSFFSLIIGLIIAYLLLPYLNKWFSVNILISQLANRRFLMFVLTLLVFTSLFGGLYPAMLLAGISPANALKGKLTQRHFGGFITRKSLITVQFVISQVLIIGMIVIGRQMNFAINSDLGFDKKAVLTIPMPTQINAIVSRGLKNRLQNIPGVEHVTECYGPPSFSDNWGTSFRFDNHTEDEDFNIQVKAADQDYLKTFDLQLVAGRNFLPSETAGEIVVNETLVKKLNLAAPGEILGKRLSINHGTTRGIIVGVVADFHDMDLHSAIHPVYIAPLRTAFFNYAVKINMHNAPQTIKLLEKRWEDVFPNYIFEYEFLDDHIAHFYEAEARTLKLIQLFTILAIFISCLGMFGLVSYLVNLKTKEIGVRKVLGGSTSHVLWLFLNEFIKLILIAGLIAIPIAWLAMDKWLENFQYKIEMGVWIFGLAIGASVMIALLTIGLQSVKAALTNPAESLRSE